MDAPIKFRWDGEAMVPANARQAHLADERFVVGQYYALDEHRERSDASHSHYFAVLHDIWLSLPERIEAQFQTAEHMRKHALIACGYADKRSIVCASAAEARRVAAFVAPSDTYAVVKVEAATVTIWTAQSQSYRAMGKAVFQESKNAVLTWCADLIGVPADSVTEAAA